jgi:hypothetical protein
MSPFILTERSKRGNGMDGKLREGVTFTAEFRYAFCRDEKKVSA